VEELLLSLLELVSQVLQVLVSHVEDGVTDESLLFPDTNLALHLGYLSLELAEHSGCLDRVDEDGDVEDSVHVDDGAEPLVGEEAWIGDDEETAEHLLPQIALLRADLQGRWSDDVFELQNTRFENLLRQNRRKLTLRFFFLENRI